MSLTTADRWSTTLVHQSTGPYLNLQPLADALRLPFGKATSADLEINGVVVMLRLELDSGVVTGLTLTGEFEVSPETPTSGPHVKLRKETAKDRSDKEELLSVEVQVGARRFDEQVYIDSNASDAEVRRVLARPETRAAVLRLLDSGLTKEIELLPTVASFKLSRRGAEWTSEELVDALEQLLTLVRGSPPRGAALPHRGEGLESAAAIAFALGLATMLGALAAWSAGAVFGIAGFVIMGTATTFLARPFVKPAVAGDSGSGRRLRSVLSLLFLAGGGFGLAALLAFNALASSESAQTTVGRVTRVGDFDPEDDTWSMTVHWEDGTSSTHHVRARPSAGETAERVRQPGYFVPWDEQVRTR